MTTTTFKQKSCPRCSSNHSNDGVLCSFCTDKMRISESKNIQQPITSWVECMIERDGDTPLTMGNSRYIFKRNSRGHVLCEILNLGHYNQIIATDFYRPYLPDVDYAAEDTQELDEATISALQDFICSDEVVSVTQQDVAVSSHSDEFSQALGDLLDVKPIINARHGNPLKNASKCGNRKVNLNDSH